MTENEVNQLIAKDLEAINNAPFPDELPPWFLDNFGEIIMEMPQKDNNYFVRTVKSILSKGNNTDKLTVYEGGFVCNILCSVAPKTLGIDLKTFLDRKETLEKIMGGFNAMMKKEERKLEAKKQSMMSKLRPQNRLVTV